MGELDGGSIWATHFLVENQVACLLLLLVLWEIECNFVIIN